MTPGPLRRAAFDRFGAHLAVTAFVIALTALAGTVYLAVGNAALVDASTAGIELLWAFAWIGFAVVGLVLVVKRPSRSLGWVLLGIPAVVYGSLFLSEYAVRGLVVAPGSLPLALWAGWLAKWSFVPMVGLVLATVLLFPDERVEGRWMRRVAAAIVGLVGVETTIVAVEPGPIRGDLHGEQVQNPLGLTALGDAPTAAAGVVGGLLAVLAVLVVVDAIVRWRRATGIRRQQFRWFASAVATFPVLFVATVSDPVNQLLGWDPVVLAFFFGMNGIAAAIGLAITRYRLYEIDRVVNRAVVYTSITVVLVALYVASVIALQWVLSPITSGSDLAVAASTLSVAAAFGPVRRRVQRIVDRRFNRSRYDASRVVEAFGQRLRDEVELASLSTGLRAVTAETVAPRSVSLWLRRPAPRDPR